MISIKNIFVIISAWLSFSFPCKQILCMRVSIFIHQIVIKWFELIYLSIIRIVVCSDTFIIVFMHLKSKSIKSMTVKCITMIHVLQYIFYLNSHHVPFCLSRENVYNFYFLFLRAGKQEFSYDTYTKIYSYDVIERSWYMAIWMRHTNLQFILKVVKMNTVQILHCC